MSCDNISLLYLVFREWVPVTAKVTARESASSVIKVPLRREKKNDYSFPGFYPFSDRVF